MNCQSGAAACKIQLLHAVYPGYLPNINFIVKPERMKHKPILLPAACFLIFAVMFFGCKKSNKNTLPPITASFTEEFIDVPSLNAKGWVIVNKTSPQPDFGTWKQGAFYTGKGGTTGLGAYSYTTTLNEYVGASGYNNFSSYDISSWFITPLLTVKNGDKVSFFTSCADQVGNVYNDRLQVLLNMSGSADVGKTATSVGGFSTTLLDINPGNTSGGYPLTWTQYSYTFSGISGTKNVRIGFRYFVPLSAGANMIGIDQFKFESQ